MSSNPPSALKAAIFGCSGTVLTKPEEAFFAAQRPLGFILFKRNCESPTQVAALVSALRGIVGWQAPVLIDQEGGRVARLGPPHWRRTPPAGVFAALAEKNMALAEEAVYWNSRLIAAELGALGIDVDCAPMADLRFPFSHDIIGDRAFGREPKMVARLAGEMARGLLDGGVIPVLKHLPGHGRAKLDSHEDLPTVDCTLAELEGSDFVPFCELSALPWGMTAHITYSAIDPEHPATLSPAVIGLIRSRIGFAGLLLTDDLSMKALRGSFAERTRQSIAAGCDAVLHCNGRMDEMQEVAEHCPTLSAEGYRRMRTGLAAIKPPQPFDSAAKTAELEKMLASA